MRDVSPRERIEALLKLAKESAKQFSNDPFFSNKVKEFEEVLAKSDEDVERYCKKNYSNADKGCCGSGGCCGEKGKGCPKNQNQDSEPEDE